MQGLQCWDANGNLTLDLTDRLTRVLGQFETGTTNGSITDANLSTGTPWILALNTPMAVSLYYPSKPLKITITGTTISWEFGLPGIYPARNSKFMYGVY